MRSDFVTLLLVVMCVDLAQAGVGSTNVAPSIRTSFVADAVLDSEDLKTVAALVRSCGLENLVEVRTFHYLPAGGKGIEAIGAEHISGRTVTYDSLVVFREGWSWNKKPTGTLEAVSMGNFWVQGIGMRDHHELTIFETEKGSIRVHVDPQIKMEVADRIVKAITTRKVQYSEDSILLKRDFEFEDSSKPSWLEAAEGSDDKYFWVSFSGGLNEYKIALRGNDIVLISMVHVMI